MIQGLVDTCTLCKALVELAHQLDGVGYLSLTVTAEEVADGNIGRTPERFACQTCQMFIEEQGGTFVGEDNCDA